MDDPSEFPWTTKRCRRGDIVRFSRGDELLEEAAIDRASYERLGTRSHVSLPLRAGGPMLGVLSFDAVRGERAWPDELVERLRLLSAAFAGALERKRMEVSLAQRLRFEQLLSSTGDRRSVICPPPISIERSSAGFARSSTSWGWIAAA